jgi:hypothetical protein
MEFFAGLGKPIPYMKLRDDPKLLPVWLTIPGRPQDRSRSFETALSETLELRKVVAKPATGAEPEGVTVTWAIGGVTKHAVVSTPHANYVISVLAPFFGKPLREILEKDSN